MDELQLVPVTGENWRDAIFLTTDPERKLMLDEQWVASNAFSLLQAHYDPNWDCRLILAGETPVGFVFYGFVEEYGQYWLCRYMIDEKHQGKGYGKRALPIAVDLIRKQYGCRDVYLSVDDGNTRALRLYREFGFEPTDQMDDVEQIYVLKGEA